MLESFLNWLLGKDFGYSAEFILFAIGGFVIGLLLRKLE